jgi:WD40 repeat protein
MLHFAPPENWRNADHVAFNPEGRWLVAGCYGYGVVAFDAVNQLPSKVCRTRTNRVYGVLISSAGGWCWVPGAWDGLVRIRYPEFTLADDPGQDRSAFVGLAALSDDGRTLSYSRDRPPADGEWYEVLGCSPTAGGELTPSWVQSDAGWRWVAAAFLPDGEQFVSVEYKHPDELRRLVVRFAASGGARRELSCHGKEITAVAVSPDGRWLVGRSRQAVWVWGGSDWTGKPRKLATDTRKGVSAVAFHPSGRCLAVTSLDETVKLYDTATWQLAKTFTWQVGRLRSVAFSHDGTRAAVGSDTGKVVVWDVDL